MIFEIISHKANINFINFIWGRRFRRSKIHLKKEVFLFKIYFLSFLCKIILSHVDSKTNLFNLF